MCLRIHGTHVCVVHMHVRVRRRASRICIRAARVRVPIVELFRPSQLPPCFLRGSAAARLRHIIIPDPILLRNVLCSMNIINVFIRRYAVLYCMIYCTRFICFVYKRYPAGYNQIDKH